MDRLAECMETHGLAAGQIRTIMAAVKDYYEGYVPKYRFDEVNEAKKQREAEVRELRQQVEALRQSYGAGKLLREQIDKLQADYQAARERYEADLDDLRMTAALRLAIGSDVHDADLALSLLDKSIVELDGDGRIKSGLAEQVDALRRSHAFLFVAREKEKG